MVLCRRTDSELLSICPIRPELAVLMVESSSACMADIDSDHHFLRWNMDRVPLHFLTHVEKPLMGAPGICHGTRRPSLGPNSLEHLEHGPVSALDSGADREWSGRTVVMVVAGSAGCRSRRR